MSPESMDGCWDGDDKGCQGWAESRYNRNGCTVRYRTGRLPLAPVEDTTDTDCLCHRNLFRFSLLAFFFTEIISLSLRIKTIQSTNNNNVQNRCRIKRKKITTVCVRKVGLGVG